MGRHVLRLFLASSLFAGCGSVKDSGTTIDAPDPGDAGPDADESGMATIVTETALFGTGAVGANVGMVDIISMLPNNTVLEMKQTDAGGNATIKVYPGGTVTAVYKHTVDMGADLITWVGVQPGDTLTFGNRQPSTQNHPNNNLGTQTYSWPLQAGVTSYNVFTSCTGIGANGNTTSVQGTEFSTCHKEPMDVLYGGFTGASGLTHFNFRSNVTFSNGANVSIGGWAAAQMATVNITGLPADFTSLSGNFATILDSDREIGLAGGYNGTPTGGAFTANFNWHPTGERTVGNLFLGRPGFSSMRLMDSFSSNTLAQTIASPSFPPFIQSGVISSSALRMATWFLVPEANSTADGQMLRVNWSHNVSGTNHPHQWHFILPPDQTSIVFPKLPAQFNDNLPFPQDGMGASVRVFDISTIADYNALRAQPSRNPMCLECAVRAGDYQRVVFTP